MDKNNINILKIILSIALIISIIIIIKDGPKNTEQIKKEIKKKIVINKNKHRYKSLNLIKNIMFIKTNNMKTIINKVGGDVVTLELVKYKIKKNENKGFNLIDCTNKKYYIAQSGLISSLGPDSKKYGRIKYKNTELKNIENKIKVNLLYENKQNIKIKKTINLNNDDYLINIKYKIKNNNKKKNYKFSPYGRLKKKYTDETSVVNRSYHGTALFTENTPFKKITFDDIENNEYKEKVEGGWISIIEHYFLTAWVPSNHKLNSYSTEKFSNNIKGIRFLEDKNISIEPNEKKTLNYNLYAGPTISNDLKEISNGLELTIDYGILWMISKPMFILLEKINTDITNNWGLSIIIITILIKIILFPLASYSYKSIAKMKKFQPEIEELKKKYPDQKKFGPELLKIYKKENINPLSGCLPIILQIPIFISLYYVLLGSIELRHAPFMFWIDDLSNKDPYFILPILMAISMVVQQKVNPKPTDPIQEKMMLLLPIFLLIIFIQFPAGLVLYWLFHNLISIIQQIYITKKYNKDV